MDSRYLNFRFLSIWTLVLMVFLGSCSPKTDPIPENTQSNLVSTQQVGQYDKQSLVLLANDYLGPAGLLVSGMIQSDVKCYKVSYNTTTPEGEKVQASGALMVSDLKSQSPLISIQHGTIFDQSDAPSHFKTGTESMIGIVLASMGFNVIMPDYLGYGDSKELPHPYEHADGLATSNIDFLKAVKDYMLNEKGEWNGDLVLMGYSEGGYATLATQKKLEEDYLNDFNIKTSLCGAGAYNKSKTLEEIILNSSYGSVAHNRSYIWVIETYNRIYGLDRPMSYYFKEPYAEQIELLGNKVSLDGSLNSFLNPVFVQNFGAGLEVEVMEAFRENDLISWNALSNTILIHGDADDYVPYFNSVTAYEGMKAAGSKKLKFETVKGGTHESSVLDFFLQAYSVILNLKK